MKHFFSTKVKVILVVAILLAASLAVISNLTDLSVGQMMVQGVLTPLRAGASALTDQAEQIYNYIFRYETLAAENEALKQQLSEMEDAARRADSLARENERLREALELKEAHADYELVDSYIISWNSTDWTSSFTIDKGTASGIEVGMCAITQRNEVVGLVTEVGINYAVVKTVLDSSVQISATIASSGYPGMVRGGYSTDSAGLLRMEYIPSSAVLRNNDQVVTAGSTGYPRNLILGNIVDAGFTDTGVAKFALLEPAADIVSLEQVFILTDYDVG